MAIKNVALSAETQDAVICASLMQYIFSTWMAVLDGFLSCLDGYFSLLIGCKAFSFTDIICFKGI